MAGTGQPYRVDSHPQKNKIVQMIIDGRSVRDIAKAVSPPIDFNAIQRYKVNVIKPVLDRAHDTNRILIGEGQTKPAPEPLSRDTNAIQMATQAIKDAPVLSIFRQRLEKLHGRIDRSLDKAETAVRVTFDKESGEEVVIGADLGVIAPLLNQAHKNLEILGRATGELEPSGGAGVSIQILCPSAPNANAMPRVTYAADEAIEASFEEIGIKQIG